MKIWCRPFSVVVLAAAATLSLAGSDVGLDIRVTLKPNTPVQTFRSLVEKSGSIIGTHEDNSFTVRLKDPDQVKAVVAEWKKNPSFVKLTVLEPRLPQMNMTGVPIPRLKDTIQSYRNSYTAWLEFKGQTVDEAELPGLGYLEAYLQYAEIRSYPYDSIDYSGYADLARRRIEATGEFGKPKGEPRLLFSSGRQTGNERDGDQSNGGSSAAAEWIFLGPKNLDVPYTIYYGVRPTSGRVGDLAYDPQNPAIRYLGGAQGGVWKTTDSGANWKPLTDDWPNLCVSSLTVHPLSTGIVLAGTGDYAGGDKPGYGIMRSTDGGTVWAPTAIASGSGAISDIEFFPDNPNVVFATSGQFGSTGRIWRSVDAGQTWAPTTAPATSWANLDVGVRDGNGVRTIWAVGYGTNNVYKSTDQGVTWTPVSVPQLSGSQGAMSVAASDNFSGTAYIMSSSQQLVLKTTDGGATWSNITAGIPTGNGYNWSQAWYDYHLETSSVTRNGQPQDIVFVSLIDIVMSDDGGSTWRSIGGTGFSATYSNNAVVHNDQHCFKINPQNPLEFMAGNDGGVYSGTYSPTTRDVTWTGLSKTLGISQFYTFAMYPGLSNHVMGGTQDNATPHSLNDLLNWRNVVGGDGAGCAINYQNVNIQYGSWQNHGLWRTTNAWQSRTSFSPNFSGQSVPFIGDMWIDPNNPRYLYINTNYVDRYDAQNNSWAFLSNASGSPLTSGRVNALAIAPGNSNRIYAGTTNAELWMSQNFGASWVRIDRVGQANGLPNKAITSISVNPSNQDSVLVGFSGGGADHLYECSNTIAPQPAWANRSGLVAPSVLPSISLNDVVRDPLDPQNVWYAATDGGVWRTNDAGKSWEDISQPYGLPNVEVRKLYANAVSGNIYAATYGRGMWMLQLTSGLIRSVQFFQNPGFEEDSGTLRVVFDKRSRVPRTLTMTSSNAVIPGMNINVPAGAGQILVPVQVGSVNSTQIVTLLVTDPDSNSKSVEVTVYDQRAAYPTGVTFTNASGITGSVSNLQASDNQYLSWQIDNTNLGNSSAEFSGNVPSFDPAGLRIDLEMSANQSSLPYRTHLFDWSQNAYVVVASGIVPMLVDGTANLNVSGDPSRYLDAAGNFKAKIEVQNSLFAPNYLVKLDKLQFRFR